MSTCSTVSRDLDEPVSGTAPTATTWLLLEQPGPWGAKALTSSHLDPALGRTLEEAVKGTGVRVALIRRPGRHADRGTPVERRVYAAHTVPGNVWVHATTIRDPRRLLDLDFAALGRGDHRGFDSALDGGPHLGDPLALVCTNGKRDRCCALLGRPLAAELAASGAAGVWEVTHLGGHRFSPTVLVLPHGYVYGRVQAHDVKQILHGAREGRIVVEGCRGNSAWERPGQAAELALRATLGEDTAGALSILRTDGAAPRWEVTLAHADGRHWRVTVTQGASSPPRPESCGASVLGSPARMEVTAVRALTVTSALAS
ncbi:sucrase ferredoxin [Streptomyces sp. WAC 04229]|uniref:sucrase ferredoxin n=1 Tax=Streptomyces sp. WAC 04229 TaxID=2203206 RepID=UPI000F7423E9|nr:sucrase ferredoxin [Streptomyces sp. WAC 04229]RSN41029.1 sucrase ferredoxin [Streptomyces sp. WAC 04229]